MSYYYEIEKSKLQDLEQVHGLPDSMLTRSWDNVTTSNDGLWVIIESSEPLDEVILGVSVLTLEQARVVVNSERYLLDI